MVMDITHRQRQALATLANRHDEYPDRATFASVHLGSGTAALLRKLVDWGLVSVTNGGPGSRQFFAITDKGRAALMGTL